MNIRLSGKTVEETEKLLLTLIIGLLNSLKLKIVSLGEVEQALFSPYTMRRLKEEGVRQEIIDIVHLGTELEDVVSLVPEQYDSTIDDMLDKAISLSGSVAIDLSLMKKWVD